VYVIETLLCAAVGTASQQQRLQACPVYRDPTVCSCRHSKSAASVNTIYSVLYTMHLGKKNIKKDAKKIDKAISNTHLHQNGRILLRVLFDCCNLKRNVAWED